MTQSNPPTPLHQQLRTADRLETPEHVGPGEGSALPARAEYRGLHGERGERPDLHLTPRADDDEELSGLITNRTSFDRLKRV